MKTKFTNLSCVISLLALFGSPSFAQEAEQKPEAEEKPPVEKESKPEAEAPIAWLGVGTNKLSPDLASQLELDGGAVVTMVVPNSPAARAGLEKHDIITSLGSEEIAAPSDLSRVIRVLKPDSETKLKIVRKAELVELTATLGKRPKMLGQALKMKAAESGDPEAVREQVEKMLEQMRNESGKEPKDPESLQGADIVRMGSKSTSFNDGDGSLTITSKDGKTHLKANDVEGKLLYDGPAETPEDREKIPAKVLEKLERFEKMKIDIDLKRFQGKLLPPNVELPEPEAKPAEPQKPASYRGNGSLPA